MSTREDNRRWVWKVTFRELARVRSISKRDFTYRLIVSNHDTERDTLVMLKSCKFTHEWWAEHLVTDLELLGEVWWDQGPYLSDQPGAGGKDA